MQSLIVIALMSACSIFALSEMSRNDNTNTHPSIRADNVAGNIFSYQTLISQYILANYDTLHLMVSQTPGTIEQLKILNYYTDNLSRYTQKNLIPYLNYQSIVFNYVNPMAGEDKPMPTLYIATTWNNYASTILTKSFTTTSLPEVMGKLGDNLSKHIYQGNSTYWIVPWIFKQQNCQILEMYSGLPDDSIGNNQLPNLKSFFNLICTQIQAKSSYRFMTYVYLAPTFNTDT